MGGQVAIKVYVGDADACRCLDCLVRRLARVCAASFGLDEDVLLEFSHGR